jgi:hypothetical protein
MRGSLSIWPPGADLEAPLETECCQLIINENPARN